MLGQYPPGGVKKSPFHIRYGEAFKNLAGFLEFGKFGPMVLRSGQGKGMQNSGTTYQFLVGEKNTQYGHIDNSYVKIFVILKLANFSISGGCVY